MDTSIRSYGWTGPHWVVWQQGIPEAVEEFVESGIKRFHDLFLGRMPISVEWSEAGDAQTTFAIDCIGEAGVYAQVLTVSDHWWSTTPEQRERDLVMTLLIARCVREGILSVGDDNRQFRLKVGETEFLEEEDSARELNEMAASLIADR